MRTQDIALLLLSGLAIWVIGTVSYAYTGPTVLERSSLLYGISLFTSAAISCALCIAILRWRAIPQMNWATAMLLLAIPGMFGEAVVLTHLTAFMPKLHAASAGRYAAFLFATYAVVLGVAEIVTLKVR